MVLKPPTVLIFVLRTLASMDDDSDDDSGGIDS